MVAPVLMFLSGCVTTPSTLPADLNRLVGQPLDLALQRLGLPDRQFKAGDTEIIVWAHSFQGVHREPEIVRGTTTTNGTRSTYEETRYIRVPYKTTCTIKMAVDENSRIKSWEMPQMNAACRYFESANQPAL